MAASTGRQKSKFNFAQSVEESFTKSLSEETTPIESPKSNESKKESSNCSSIFKESIFKDPTQTSVKKHEKIEYDDEYNDDYENLKSTKANYVSDPHKIDMKQLRVEALTKQPSKSGNKAITFSVACKKNGELEKIIDVASQSFGFNRSLYIRSLIYNDYINNKEKYDRLLELS